MLRVQALSFVRNPAFLTKLKAWTLTELKLRAWDPTELKLRV